MSKVDVIVPCYQYGHFLQQCVESVLTQEGVELRVLIIDDASPDGTSEVAAQLAARDERVCVRRHSLNQGHIATYNEGLEWAAGDYILLLDADDVLTPGALLRSTLLMDANPEVGMTYGRARVTEDPAREIFPAGADRASRTVGGREWIESVCETGLNHVRQPTVVVRTKLQKELGGYCPALPHAGDMGNVAALCRTRIDRDYRSRPSLLSLARDQYESSLQRHPGSPPAQGMLRNIFLKLRPSV